MASRKSLIDILSGDTPSMSASSRDRVAEAQIRTGPQMASFIRAVVKSSRSESGRKGTPPAQWYSMSKRVPKKRVAKTLAPMFAKLRDWASAQGAPKTAAAVVQAASWFWKNVEQPRQASSGGGFIPSGVSAALTPPGQTGAPKLPLTQQVWFWPAVIGAGGLLLVGLILAMPGKEK